VDAKVCDRGCSAAKAVPTTGAAVKGRDFGMGILVPLRFSDVVAAPIEFIVLSGDGDIRQSTLAVEVGV
jgi:hypothetical protein